jgi:anti-sigma28 factor (negative regulator of flagellin synthesis)
MGTGDLQGSARLHCNSASLSLEYSLPESAPVEIQKEAENGDIDQRLLLTMQPIKNKLSGIFSKPAKMTENAPKEEKTDSGPKTTADAKAGDAGGKKIRILELKSKTTQQMREEMMQLFNEAKVWVISSPPHTQRTPHSRPLPIR